MCADDCVCPDGSAFRGETDEFDPPIVMLAGAVDADATAAWCAQVRALLLGGHRSIWCDVRGLSGRAAAAVEAVARIQLTARRSGGRVRVLCADDRLLAVFELAGLTDLWSIAEHGPPR
ncbi:STAS domain-containing protein [Nocardia sp. NBC_00881]|uniref:STAS domain-containing protein n=1 Tax=Nocardia sp. NBC_00881 TaxID=2975995 RepID=UPI003866C19B|nr:STAS domain-containing protein [Nocardia sp. NBC_00881]